MAVSSVFVAGAMALGLVLLAQPQISCAATLPAALTRPAAHANVGHLAANLFAFYVLSQSIQPRIGTLNYVLLIAFLWLTTSLMDIAFKQRCSIGFSGVVLGLLVWDLFDRGQLKFDLAALAALAFVWLQPMLAGQSNVSMSGHLYGLLAGLVAVVATRALKSTGPPVPQSYYAATAQ
jgi:membrane associated rhomboid family serine protease